MRRVITAFVTLALVTILNAGLSSASEPRVSSRAGVGKQAQIILKAAKQRAAEQKKARARSTPPPASTPSWAKYKSHEESFAQIQDRLTALGALGGATWNACNTAKLYCPPSPKLIMPPAPILPLRPPESDTAPPPIPGEVVAYAAVAELNLTAPTPEIGPPPSINRWKIAAVGYPLWLSVAGDTDPARVTSRAFDIAVSLDARLTKVVFDMGDGQRVSCTDATRAWGRWVEPGTPSPTCGYRYTEPSLPRGAYTVTAQSYWSVDWRTPDASGTLNLVQAAATELPVGELQVVVR